MPGHVYCNRHAFWSNISPLPKELGLATRILPPQSPVKHAFYASLFALERDNEFTNPCELGVRQQKSLSPQDVEE